jgi:UDPglucose 6-dehydrogenase
MSKYKIGICGSHGMVGGSLRRYFETKKNYRVLSYDLGKNIGSMEEINKADFIYICVPTPYIEGKGCDTSIVEKVIDKIDSGKVVIIKSTVIPGTTDRLQEKYPDKKLLFNPEFLTEVTADNDTRFPDRQIIGYTEKSFTVAKDIALQLPLAPYEKIVPAKVAEMIKYGTNTWFAVKVAKNNELYDLAKVIGFTEEEWEEMVSGLAADKRIERTHLTILHKGKRGYHGKCLPKDAKALLDFAKENGVEMNVLKAANDYNDELLTKQNISKYV